MDRDRLVEQLHGNSEHHRVARRRLVHRQHHQLDDPCAKDSHLPIHF